jgi:hypothetical protein
VALPKQAKKWSLSKPWVALQPARSQKQKRERRRGHRSKNRDPALRVEADSLLPKAKRAQPSRTYDIGTAGGINLGAAFIDAGSPGSLKVGFLFACGLAVCTAGSFFGKLEARTWPGTDGSLKPVLGTSRGRREVV